MPQLCCVPEVKLYISPTGACGTANSAQIIKGSPARLCWSTTLREF